jgi:hypothetical protein
MAGQHVSIALKTLTKIEEMIHADQGTAFKAWEQKILPHISDAYREDNSGHRSHLGCSVLGNECGRAVWYDFRWVTKSKFSGQMIRLFNRGHLEEGRFLSLLLMIGCQIYQQDENGKQFRISYADGHAGGSGDGVAIGIPDLAPGTAALCEFKTHNQKSFDELAGSDWRKYIEYVLDPEKAPVTQFSGKGVREAKTQHYIQLQMYMRKMGLSVTLYAAVNKNTDEIYMELIPLNAEFADQCFDRGEKLVWMPEPPERISKSPGFYKCRWCDHKPVCHLNVPPDVNCRTCRWSQPLPGGDGLWRCSHPSVGKPINKEEQLAACPEYTLKSCF